MIQRHFDTLAHYEEQLSKAGSGNFYRFAPDEFEELAVVYREMYGVAVTRADRNCATCRMKIVKQLARAFDEAKAQRARHATSSESAEASAPKRNRKKNAQKWNS